MDTNPPAEIPWLTVAGVLAGVLSVLALITALLVLGAPPHATDDKPSRQSLRVDDQTRLARYGWVDAKAGTAHIPAERAAELLLKEKAK